MQFVTTEFQKRKLRVPSDVAEALKKVSERRGNTPVKVYTHTLQGRGLKHTLHRFALTKPAAVQLARIFYGPLGEGATSVHSESMELVPAAER